MTREPLTPAGMAAGSHDRHRRSEPLRRLAGFALLAVLATALLAASAQARLAGAAATETAKAPAVTKNPVSLKVEAGQPASFTATASGTPVPTVQWQVSTNGGTSWSAITGATQTTLTISSAATSESGEQLRAVFKNPAGEATSKAATLTVQQVPAVTQQPQPVTVEEGATARFEAAASGFPAPTVQWQQSTNGGSTWSSVSGATQPTLTLAATKASQNGYEYRALFKNAAGTATSEAAKLTVQKAPAITRQPVATTVEAGSPATFEAAASGLPAPSVQWQVSGDGGQTWTPVPGATAPTLTIAEAQIEQDGDLYRAVFSNAAGTATTSAVALTVRERVTITQQPQSQIVQSGEPVTFQTAATGYPAPTVQWQLSTNGGQTWTAIEGATQTTLTLASTQTSMSGYQYRALFTNPAGSLATSAATLTVASHKYRALAWGENLERQLGAGSTSAFSPVPLTVTGLEFVTAVAAGANHGLALRADGTVLGWGSDEEGQLGNGESETISAAPVAASGLSGASAIAAGGDHSLALLSNGTVMAWGSNEHGELGNGTKTASSLPVAVKGLTNVRQIAAGEHFSLALLQNGTVMAWGAGESGELGNGATKDSTTPVTVKGLTGVSQVAAGDTFAVALLADGTVKAWGADENGQLGTAVEATEEGAHSDVPVLVGGLTGVSAVAAGEAHGLALLSGGTVMAWGAGGQGQLGDGATPTSQPAPVGVSGLAGVSQIAAGGGDSAALLSSGSIMTWGANHWGTLGDGTSPTGSDVPVQVAGIRSAADIAVGSGQMYAFGEPIPVITGLSPSLAPAAGGTTVTITGAGFTGATAVYFGAAPATTVTVESDTTITVTSPAGSGTVDVKVVAPSGESVHASADRFTYQQPPTVTKISPRSGPTTGGTKVTITGTEFTGATAVHFGSLPAQSYKVLSPTQIEAVAPAQGEGGANIEVTNLAGTSAPASANVFKYTPTVESVSPASGPAAGGTEVTVTGTGFSTAPKGTTVKFGTTLSASVTCSGTTTCTAIAPAHLAGTVSVIVSVGKVNSPANAAATFKFE